MADEPLPTDPNSEHDRHNDGSENDRPVEHLDPAPAHVSDPVSEINQPARYIQPAASAEPVVEEDEEGGPVKSFLEHLEDLRWVLIKTIASVLIAMTVCMVAANTISEFLQVPLMRSGAHIEIKTFTLLWPVMSPRHITFC